MIPKRDRLYLEELALKLIDVVGMLAYNSSNQDLIRIANLQGVAIVRSSAMGSLQGSISVTSNGPAIRVNAQLSSAEHRCVIAHELAHTMIDPDLPFPRNRVRIKTDRFAEVAPGEREILCDYLGAALLLPEPLLQSHLFYARHDQHLMKEVSRTFNIEENAATMRIMRNLSCHGQLALC